VRIVLFDIDGTLLHARGAGRRAFESAARALCGGDVPCGFSFAGMTDRAIARRYLRAAGLPEDAARIDALVAEYVSRLEGELAAGSEVEEVPGAKACLSALVHERDRVALGIGTGNVRQGAERKLGRAGLLGYFRFGGYGCDAEERSDVLRAGVARGRALFGDAGDVVVVGDTLKDVAAAMAIGASCIGIATGTDTHEALRAAGARVTFDDLRDPTLLRALLD
jgi:phosphoglycolate phosphatase-like HAD superfamily hydrolase